MHMKKFAFTIIAIFSLFFFFSSSSMAQTGTRTPTEKTVTCLSSTQMPIAVQSARLIADGENSLLEYTFENQSNEEVQEVIFWLTTSNPTTNKVTGNAWLVNPNSGIAPGTQLQLVLPINRISLNADSLTATLLAVAASTPTKTFIVEDSVFNNLRSTTNEYSVITEHTKAVTGVSQGFCSRYHESARKDCQSQGLNLISFTCFIYSTGEIGYECGSIK